jgi:hypothetical protein
VSTFDSQTLDSLQGIKTKLFNLLDKLETNINNDMVTSQTNELVSTETMADFELSIEIENKYYISLIKNLTSQLNDTMDTFVGAWNDFQNCKQEFNSWESALSATQDQLNNFTDYYQSKKQQFQNFIDLFTALINYYKKEIYSASDDYKQRADDYIGDENFNSTSNFTKRSADQYNNLSGSVQSSTYSEAQSESLSQLKSNKIFHKKAEEESGDEILKRADRLREKIKNLTKMK